MTALEYYQLKEQPFGVTPDARYLFLTPGQQDALSSVIYGMESGCGLVALIARPGLGKTTLLYQTLHILREKARLVFLFQTIPTPADLLRALLSGLGVQDLGGSLVEMQIRLKELLTEQYGAGKRVVVVIDEAQNLEDPVLEMVRMLSNFETTSDKLIQFVLAGQPQLGDNIGSPELLQLRQRVSIFARLQPLTTEETVDYIAHRLQVAGYGSDKRLFTRDALELIAEGSEGIPRNINNLCFNALTLGCGLKQKPIDRSTLRRVIDDLDPALLRGKISHPVPAMEERVVVLKATAAPPRATPAAARAKRGPAVAARWLPKVAFALVALVVIAGAMLVDHQWLGRTAAAQPPSMVAAAPAATASAPERVVVPKPAVVAAPAPAAAADTPVPAVAALPPPPPAGAEEAVAAMASSSPEGETTPPSRESPDLVLVAPGQTLLGICVAKFGNCTAQILRQIHQLNPSLNDLDHIETGQTLWIPVPATQSIEP
jgi:type II secretory pathway predicted ATPase ExeA